MLTVRASAHRLGGTTGVRVTGWNLADVFDTVAATVPDAPAVVQGTRRLSWRELDERAQRMAVALSDSGLVRGDKVVQHLRNRSEYLESFMGSLKASLVPVNSNYRYGAEELTHLWRDCDARAVVFSGSFTATVERVRPTVPDVLLWLWVDDGVGACPEWATSYESVAGAAAAAPARIWERDGDDLVLLYTGGTTGLPKGVMWRQDDLLVLLGNAAGGRYPDEPDLAYARARVPARGRRHLPAAPLMHGAGSLTCLPVLARGGTVVFLESESFDAAELLDTVEREAVDAVSWVGDAFARPVLAALDERPGRDLASWSLVTSGGALFSDDVKRRLHEHLPGLMIADVYGSSEALAAARSVSQSGDAPAVRDFSSSGNVVVLDDEGAEVPPGSGTIGRVAYTGRLPLGYYRDQRKSEETFRVVNGRRCSFTGDFATVTPEGRISLLGRGSSCINTGGEKVYPEEVEEVLKRHPAVDDAAVLGVPDERFGERIVAAVQLAPGQDLDVDVLRDHVRQHLASYKVPREVVGIPSVPRGPSGKLDAVAVRELLGAAPART